MVYDNNRKKTRSGENIRLTNLRYSDVNKENKFYIARDEEQFLSTLKMSFNHQKSDYTDDSVYSGICGDAIINTFRYIFEKFKKGIYVKIVNNKLDLFLPFSNIYFRNEWYNRIKFPTTNSAQSIEKWLIEEYYSFTNYDFSKDKDSTNITEWYANNCLLRFDKSGGFINDRDTNISALYEMLQNVCDQCNVPDVEFFLNKRDFPLLKKDLTEPYNHIWDSKNQPLVSHKYEKYCPIISMSNTNDYSDILFPTYEDWYRVTGKNNVNYSKIDSINWSDKTEKAVFRGSLTGCGIVSSSENEILYNPRLKARILCKKYSGYLDAGIISKTNSRQWNRRPRKLEGFSELKIPKEGKIIKNFIEIISKKYKNFDSIVQTKDIDDYLENNNITINLENYKTLDYITIKELIKLYKQNTDCFVVINKNCKCNAIIEDDIADYISFEDQCKFKYILHIEGHTAAQRLSSELCSNSLILMCKSKWKLWYSDMLIGFDIENFDHDINIDSIDAHYVFVDHNLDNLINVIKKCKENDAICQKIASNARKFYDYYLSDKKNILEYIENTIKNINNRVNVKSIPCRLISDIQLDFVEKEQLTYKYPKSNSFDFNKKINLSKYTNSVHCLKALNWVFDKFAAENNQNLFKFDNPDYEKIICINKLGIVYKYNFNKVALVFKETNLKFGNKHKEHIHDSFIGTKCINNILEYCPNFTYTFGCYAFYKKYPLILNTPHLMNKAGGKLNITRKDLEVDNLTYISVNKYIQGQTFSDYLYNCKNDKNFKFNDYLSILLQIFLSLEIAQRKCAFVHNDLMPWNIMIKKETNYKNFTYIIGRKTYQVKTKLIPYIIDFGKSNAVHDNIKYGIGVNVYKLKIKRFNDVFTILSSTLNIILENSVKDSDKQKIITLCNFICNTEFKNKQFETINEVVTFFKSYKKYSILTYSNKLDLHKFSPVDYVNYIINSQLLYDSTDALIKYNDTKNFKIKVLQNFDSNMCIHKENNSDIQINYKKNELLIYNEILDIFNGNCNQFNILLSFLKKLIKISKIKNNNILTRYYCSQILLINYLLTNNKLLNIVKKYTNADYNNSKIQLSNLWSEFMGNLEYIKNYDLDKINIEREISVTEFNNDYPEYTEYTFLNIDAIYSLLKNYKLEFNNNYKYDNSLVKTLLFKHSNAENLNSKLNNNTYIVNCELPNDIRLKFKDKLLKIIDIDYVKNIEVSSWSKTLYYCASKMFSNENMSKFDDENLIEKYNEKRNKIFQILDRQYFNYN